MRAVVIHPPHRLEVADVPDTGLELGPDDVLVRMAAGGICGSDLHYYHHGGFGAVRVREKMVLGHEASGHVEAVGSGVTDVRKGDLVAVNPSQPCGHCGWCEAGAVVHCENMQFNGSAMRLPHVQGFFREWLIAPRARVFRIESSVAPEAAALCEPFAVALHAVAQAGDLRGKTVLVTGCGPIGGVVIAAARLKGAERIIATDVAPFGLGLAARLGCDTPIDVGADPAGLEAYAAGRGGIDVCFECSGNPRALAGAVATLKPQGRLVLVGLGGDAPLPVNTIVAREISVHGSFRFAGEFAEAAALISTGAVDLSPLLTATYPMADAVAAFEHASDKSRAAKITLAL